MNNTDLARDIDSIKALVPRRRNDNNLDQKYLIDIADNGYFYTNEYERDSDYQEILNQFQTYQLKDTTTGEEVDLTIDEILSEINRDRTEGFLPYTTEDWREGLAMTRFELVEDMRLLQILPYNSVINGDDESDVALWHSNTNICERQPTTLDDSTGLCDTSGLYYGTSDSREPKFCARHFYQEIVMGDGVTNYRLSQ